jgi:hypothetical protein
VRVLPSTIAKNSNGIGLQYYWRQDQGYPGSSLAVTTARVALDFKSSGLEDGVGLGLWMGDLGFGLVIRPGAIVVGKAKGVWS